MMVFMVLKLRDMNLALHFQLRGECVPVSAGARANGLSGLPPRQWFGSEGVVDISGSYLPEVAHQIFRLLDPESLHFLHQPSLPVAQRSHRDPRRLSATAKECFRRKLSSRFVRAGDHIQELHRIFFLNGWKILKELLESKPVIPIVHEGLCRDPGSSKHDSPTQNIRGRGDRTMFHCDHLHSIPSLDRIVNPSWRVA